MSVGVSWVFSLLRSMTNVQASMAGCMAVLATAIALASYTAVAALLLSRCGSGGDVLGLCVSGAAWYTSSGACCGDRAGGAHRRRGAAPALMRCTCSGGARMPGQCIWDAVWHGGALCGRRTGDIRRGCCGAALVDVQYMQLECWKPEAVD